MSTRCIACQAPACRAHHPTGRDHKDQHLDGDLTVPVCHDDHELVHDDRRTLGIQDAEAPLCWFERVELRLRRVASDFARLCERYPQNVWTARAAALLTRWADELAAGLRTLDARDPEWRSDPAFYPQDVLTGA